MREFFFLGSREKKKLFHAHTSSFFLLLFPQQVHAKAGKADEAGEALKAPKMKAPKVSSGERNGKSERAREEEE